MAANSGCAGQDSAGGHPGESAPMGLQHSSAEARSAPAQYGSQCAGVEYFPRIGTGDGVCVQAELTFCELFIDRIPPIPVAIGETKPFGASFLECPPQSGLLKNRT
jgi:hypothetical protein